MDNESNSINGFAASTINRLSLLTIISYFFIVPSYIFIIIYFNILGIPSLPSLSESMFFVGRVLLSSTVSATHALFIIIVFGSFAFYLATKIINHFKNMEKYKIQITGAILILLALISITLKQNYQVNSEISASIGVILLFFSLIVLPIALLLGTKIIIEKSLRITKEDKSIFYKYLFNYLTAIIACVFILVIVCEAFVSNYQMFPQVDSKYIRLWLNENAEYVMSCNQDMGTILVRKSSISQDSINNKAGELNEHQINTINTDRAHAICSRIFKQ
jgi:hypothetical protein